MSLTRLRLPVPDPQLPVSVVRNLLLASVCAVPLSMASIARLPSIWKMLAVMPSVICRMRRRDFGVSTEDRRNGVLRRIDAISVSKSSLAAQRFRVNCSKRRAS